ncbi:TMV resistance protein N-like [Lotus japonicus]|uniref:TMV resistance protein N-like n=1 Tax=Lotus japonicus TaxID=34305 RepID=UPI0025905E9F|nr:TMV resistance protein N-like [Lotus japonicus]
MNHQQIINFASSSMGSQSHPKKHDVFLSFRGEDTRDNITSHLHEALIQKKIETYIDYRLEKGDEISSALIRAIEESHVSVVIFSENYANSKWCLDEITKIIECMKDHGQVVIPVFYKVDPSHVRKQTGSFKEAFAKHEVDLKGNNEKVQKWKSALTKAANLAGWDFQTYRTESGFIKDIVEDVLHKLNLRYPIELKGLVGIEGNYVEVEPLLKIGSGKVRMIGIWGMGGIGKTTLAIALHAKLSSQFEGVCFLASVRELSEKFGLDTLRNKLLSQLLGEENLHVDVPKVESQFVASRLRRKKVLIVLDDVATSEQLEGLIGEYDFLGPGSRVIVTTRDKHIFSHVDEVYEVKELNDTDSLQLFCLNAFREKHPKNGYEELSKSVISYCKGNPLALKVLGARLRSRSTEAWKSEVRKLQKIQEVKIHNVLKLSFDDLDRTEQCIFLDIACFLKGESRDHVTSLLEACDFYATIGIEALLDKSLITISVKDTVEMHDLIQEMGHNIVDQESINDPGKRSRLWDPQEVYDVLKYNRGTEVVEGIILDVSIIKDLHLSYNSFTKMCNIRFLKFHSDMRSDRCNIYLPNGLESLPHKLRYLQWHGYHMESLPSSFSAKFLVELSMPNSHLEKLWDGVQDLVNLKEIDLAFSQNLVEVPDLSMATKLEGLSLLECKSLREVHPSILCLHELKFLDLGGCTELETLQTEIHLKSLHYLRLSNCSSLKEFSVSSKELKELWLDGTVIQELPSSIWHCEKLSLVNLQGCDHIDTFENNKLPYNLGMGSLTRLVLSGCKQLKASNLCSILDGLQSLLLLDVENCCNLEELPDIIGLLPSLTCLKLSGSSIESLPANIKNLLMLEELWLDNCMKLVSLPELPPSLHMLSAINCTSLETDFTELRVLQHPRFVLLPGARVPDWFTYRSEETWITIPNISLSGLCGFIFCVVVSQLTTNGKDKYVEYNIYNYSNRIHSFLGDQNLISDHVFLWYLDITKGGDNSFHKKMPQSGVFNPFNIFKFSVIGEDGQWSKTKVKACGVYPVSAFELEPFSAQDIDELQPRASGIGCIGSNHDKDNYQIEKLQEEHQTTSSCTQDEKNDLDEKSPCHSVTELSCERKPQSSKDEDCCKSSMAENQIICFDTPSASNINSSQTIKLSEEKDLTDNQHLEPDSDPFAELESMLFDSYKLSPLSTHSVVSETKVQNLLEKLETLLETSLEVISLDDEVKQQLLHVLEQLDLFEDQIPVKLQPVIYKLKHFIEGVDVKFVTAQKTIHDYDQLVQSRSLLSEQLRSAKASQEHINSKVSQHKIQFEEINSEISELEEKLRGLIETRDRLKREMDCCDVESGKLKAQVAQWVPDCKNIITDLKKYETSYKVALTNKKIVEDEWADLKKNFAASKI